MCFDIWKLSVWLYSGAHQWGLYVGTETSFILRFATDLCVIFGPCHKHNVAVVTKDCLIYVFISISVSVSESESESESEPIFESIFVSVFISEYV